MKIIFFFRYSENYAAYQKVIKDSQNDLVFQPFL